MAGNSGHGGGKSCDLLGLKGVCRMGGGKQITKSAQHMSKKYNFSEEPSNDSPIISFDRSCAPFSCQPDHSP